jgi:hypothetical protein
MSARASIDPMLSGWVHLGDSAERRRRSHAPTRRSCAAWTSVRSHVTLCILWVVYAQAVGPSGILFVGGRIHLRTECA